MIKCKKSNRDCGDRSENHEVPFLNNNLRKSNETLEKQRQTLVIEISNNDHIIIKKMYKDAEKNYVIITEE